VKRLAFLQRLLTGLADSIDDHDVPHFVAEARALQLDWSRINGCWHSPHEVPRPLTTPATGAR